MTKNLLVMNTISKKFLVPTLILTIVLFSSLGIFMAKNNSSSIQSMMESKGDAVARFVSRVSADYFAIFDFTDFEKFVKALENDPEVEFAVFYNAQKEPMTSTKKVVEDTSQLIVHDREIKDADGNLLGYLKIAYNKSNLTESMNENIKIIAISTMIALLLLALGIIYLVRVIITRRVKATVEMLKDIAQGEGDLTKRLHADSSDELGELAEAISRMQDSIRLSIERLRRRR